MMMSRGHWYVNGTIAKARLVSTFSYVIMEELRNSPAMPTRAKKPKPGLGGSPFDPWAKPPAPVLSDSVADAIQSLRAAPTPTGGGIYVRPILPAPPPRNQAAWEKAHDVWGDPHVWDNPGQVFKPAWAANTDFSDPSGFRLRSPAEAGGLDVFGTGSGTAAGDALMLRNAVPSIAHSALDTVRGLGAAVTHPGKTLDNLGGLLYGSLDNAGVPGMYNADPKQRIRDQNASDATYHAMFDPYLTNGQIDPNKASHHVAQDPGDALATASTLMPVGGLGLRVASLPMRATAFGLEHAGPLAGLGAAAKGIANTTDALGHAAIEGGNLANPLTASLNAVSGARSLAKSIPFVNKTSIAKGVPLIPPTVPKFASDAARTGQAQATRFPDVPVGNTDLNAAQIMDKFKDPETHGEIADTIKAAVNEYRSNGIKATIAAKGALGTAPVDISPALDAYDAAEAKAVAQAAGATHTFDPGVQMALNNAKDRLQHLSFLTASDPLAVDAVRQGMWDSAFAAGRDPAANIYKTVAAGLRQSMINHNPAYSNILETAQKGMQAVKDFGDVGATSKTSATTVARALRAIKTPSGANLVTDLANNTESGAALPYMLAGALSNKGVTMPHPFTGGMGGLGMMVAASDFIPGLIHNPAEVGIGSAVAGASALAASPKAVIGANRAAGMLKGAVQRAGDIIPGPIKDPIAAVAEAARPGLLTAAMHSQDKTDSTTTLSHADIAHRAQELPASETYEEDPNSLHVSHPSTGTPQDKIDAAPDGEYSVDPNQDYSTTASQAPTIPSHVVTKSAPELPETSGASPSVIDDSVDPNTPQTFAAGGKVGPDIEKLVGRLMNMAKQAKKASDATTEPLLNSPDEAIVKALAVAQRAI